MNAPVLKDTFTNYEHLQDGDAFRAPLSDIDPFPGGNVRKRRDPAALNDLRQAIREANGVTQGVTVRIDPDNPSRLQLLAGYGRVECSRLEEYHDIPAVFKTADDKQALAIMLSENLDREELSVADEIIAAQRFISLYDGDYEAAAEHLNWPVKKLRGRLTLNQCSEEVIDALRDKKIAIGHAEILSAFTEKLQNGTLQKIVDENWKVEYLKERAGKANRFLKNAIFNTDDCKTCPHNSDIQASLFDNTVGKTKCNNLVCYREKTDGALEAKKSELEETHGIVLLAVEKPASDRNTVNPDVVGDNQFTTGCTGCMSNAVIMQDGINRDSGQVISNQCIDTECFRKMCGAHKKTNARDKSTQSKDSKGKTTGKASAKQSSSKSTTGKSKKTTQKTPNGVIENNKKTLRKLSAQHFDNNAHFREALAVASLIEQSGMSRDTKRWAKALPANKGLASGFNERVLQLYKLEADTLDLIKQTAYSAYLSDSSNLSADPVALTISALAADPNGKDISIAGWTATKEVLGAYLKSGISVIATKSGFASHYDTTHGENAFVKLCKGTKDTIIGDIIRTEFDWSSYSPDDYLNTLK